MDWILILGILAFGGLIIGWIGYSRITDNLLKEQEREIAKLRRENRRLTTEMEALDLAIKALEERPHGKWIIEHDWVHCFPCGHEQNYPSNFCPNCGADMRKGDED